MTGPTQIRSDQLTVRELKHSSVNIGPDSQGQIGTNLIKKKVQSG